MDVLQTEIWKLISLGNEQAFAQAYTFYYKRFYNYGKKFTEDQLLLEDAIQEALFTIWEKRSILLSLEYPASYFYNAFRYILFQKVKRAEKLVLNQHTEFDLEFSAEQILIKKETDQVLNDKLKEALQELTSKQKEAIFLRFYEGLSYDEVATILNISTKATYKIMARALDKLKETMMISSSGILFLLRSAEWVQKM
ncbi:MAG: sigma-70 family RNA polymerase sigma factor [Bacteroidia bacterium]|nr:MAG: sigma-70 family RNA polymerase sigma factor [Bacteroidia bacterium]